jgi:hypothetical protein
MSDVASKSPADKDPFELSSPELTEKFKKFVAENSIKVNPEYGSEFLLVKYAFACGWYARNGE